MRTWQNPVIFMVCLAVCPLARAEIAVDEVTRGRLVLPANAVLLDLHHRYTAPQWSDPSQDTLNANYELSYGASDRLRIEGSFQSQDIQRDHFRADRVGVEAKYLVLEEPFQLAPSLGVLPSLRGKSLSVTPGLAALKNIGRISWVVSYDGDIEQSQKDNTYGFELGEIDAGGFFHFGLHGVVGLESDFSTTGSKSLNAILGGSISNNMILSVTQEFGLTRQTADYELLLQVQFYFGRYALGGWGL